MSFSFLLFFCDAVFGLLFYWACLGCLVDAVFGLLFYWACLGCLVDAVFGLVCFWAFLSRFGCFFGDAVFGKMCFSSNKKPTKNSSINTASNQNHKNQPNQHAQNTTHHTHHTTNTHTHTLTNTTHTHTHVALLLSQAASIELKYLGPIDHQCKPHTATMHCEQCMKSFVTKKSLAKHKKRFQGKCAEMMSDEEFALLMPSWEGPWKIWCIACNKDVSISYIERHLWKEHPDLGESYKTWHVMKDMKAAKARKSLQDWSTFQFQWDIKKTEVDRISFQAGPAQQQVPAVAEAEDEHPQEAVPAVAEAEHEHPQEEVPGEFEEQVPAASEADDDPQALDIQRLQNPTPAPLTNQILQSETRILQRVDNIVVSFNEVLKEGLGEVRAKYPVELCPWVEEYDPVKHGTRFPANLLRTNFDITLFQHTIFEFRGLKLKTAQYTVRDIRRFLGCFEFPDEAGGDLSHLMVSIFKSGLLRLLISTKLWQAKKNFLKSLKWSLHHFIGFLENEERMHRAFGGLTTALRNILRALDWELSQRLKVKGKEQTEKKAQKDAELIDQWVGPEVWGLLVLKAMQVLCYIHAHREEEGFFTKDVHQLANQCLLIIIYLNTYPGRCGGWELLKENEVLQQLLQEPFDNIIIHLHHKTKDFYGPLLKWAPNSLLEAFLLYFMLPMRESEYAIVSHTPTDIVCASHVLQCACKTFGHPGAVPNTNFVRKLFATTISMGGGPDENAFANAVDDLANIDAHSAVMARSIHYDLSDRIKGGVIKKSVRSFFTTMKRMPLPFPDEELDQDEFKDILANLGKRGLKRKAAEVVSGDEELAEESAGPVGLREQKKRLRVQIQAMGKQLMEEWEDTKIREWMIRHIVDDLWYQGQEVTYLQVRYALKGN